MQNDFKPKIKTKIILYSNRQEFEKNEDIKGFCYAVAIVCILTIALVVLEYHGYI